MLYSRYPKINLEHKKQNMNANPDAIFPLKSRLNTVTHIRPTITRANIIVGEYSYYSGRNFEQECVTHHYDFIGDKLIIGRFCQIAHGVKFIMGGANHVMNTATTFPFYIMQGWEQKIPDIQNRGDTIINNDVWIGEEAVILPGVKISDGAIIGTQSVVGSDVPPYCIYAGNPARLIRKRFDDELIALMLELQWWNKSPDEINKLMPLLTCNNLDEVKRELKIYLG